MIREFQRDDINKVADIWLDSFSGLYFVFSLSMIE